MAIIRPYSDRAPALHPSAFAVESSVVVGDVEIGEESSLWFGAIARGDVNRVRIGARTNVQDHSILHVSGDHPTVVGDDVTVGHRVTLHGCTVGSRCLIGMGAVVLDGAVLSDEVMVAAGALVVPGMAVPPRTLVMGSPARVRRPLDDGEVERIRASAQRYVLLVRQYLREGWSSR